MTEKPESKKIIVRDSQYTAQADRGGRAIVGDDNVVISGQVTGDVYIHKRLPTGTLFQAPPLPGHFVERLEVSEGLKARLLAEEVTAPGVLVVSAIHGLGGIGKSVLAAALAHDPEVQERFPDGVLWVTLGQEPDLLSLLSGWVRALGDYGFHPTTVEVASAHLRTLLHDKAALLVVDDVWDPEHALPFQIGGPHSQMLITTRRADVADEVGADLYQLDVMTPEQSLGLLAARLGRAMEETERDEALRLSEAVGYLPLALELAAARIVRGVAWEVLQEALEEEIARLEALEGPRRKTHPRMEASFHLSLDALRAENEEAWRAFAWLGVLPEDVAVTAPMAATLWEMDQAEVAEILELLWNDALLLPGPPVRIGEYRWPSYRLHDLLHDLARRLLIAEQPLGLGFTLLEAHTCLLERYRPRTRNSLWHTLPDDGYIHSHLTWHMQHANLTKVLHTLLYEETTEGRNAWYEARNKLAQAAGYLQDLARARENAVAVGDIGLQIKYLLCQSSVITMGANLPVELMLQAVECGFISLEQALARVLTRQKEADRAEALVALIPLLKDHRPEMLMEVLVAAREIRANSARANTLAELAFQLTEPSREHILEEALATAREINSPLKQAQALTNLLSHLPKSLQELVLTEALAAVMEIWNVEQRASALAKLIENSPIPLSEQVVQETLEKVRETGGSLEQARALGALIPHLPTPLQEQVTEEIVAFAQEVKDDFAYAMVLVVLVQHQPQRFLKVAFSILHNLKDEIIRSQVLDKLIPYLSQDYIGEALSIAQETKHESWRANLLAKLVKYLPTSSRQSVLKEAFEAARALLEQAGWGSPRYRVGALTELIPYLSNQLQEQAMVEVMALTHRIEDEAEQTKALSCLALRLSEPQRTRVLDAALAKARAVRWEGSRAFMLAELIPHLPLASRGRVIEESLNAAWEAGFAWWIKLLADLNSHLLKPTRERVIEEALAQAWETKEIWWRTYMLGQLIPYLPTESLEQVIEEVIVREREIWNDEWRIEVLCNLVAHLPQHSREQILAEALCYARGIWHEAVRSRVLSTLAPRLSKKLIQDALTITQDMRDERWRATALAELAPHLTNISLRDAFTMALAIENEWYQVKALIGLVAQFPQELREDVLSVTREMRDVDARAMVTSALFPHLTRTLQDQILPEIWENVRTLIDRSEQAYAQSLFHLIPFLSQEMLGEALVVASTIQLRSERVGVFAALGQRILALSLADLSSFWIDECRCTDLLLTLARREREDLLSDLCVLAPIIHILGGEEAIAKTFHAIQDVGRWWP
ncbi:MAG: hypothetical protein GY832_45010 [Chloroflexi bacterium]|nr:hypothetical protein [Chloroflexota bacterium]